MRESDKKEGDRRSQRGSFSAPSRQSEGQAHKADTKSAGSRRRSLSVIESDRIRGTSTRGRLTLSDTPVEKEGKAGPGQLTSQRMLMQETPDVHGSILKTETSKADLGLSPDVSDASTGGRRSRRAVGGRRKISLQVGWSRRSHTAEVYVLDLVSNTDGDVDLLLDSPGGRMDGAGKGRKRDKREPGQPRPVEFHGEEMR